MRFTSLLLLSSMALISCHSDKTIEPVEVSGCDDPQYARARQLVDINTIVLAKTYTAANGSSFTRYYLDQPDIADSRVLWTPCNMPETYKKDKLAVRFSGYVLTFPGIESANTDGSPIELSRIEER